MIEAHYAPDVEFDESVTKFGLEPCDQQEHVIAARSYYFPLVELHYDKNTVDPELIRAEILTAVYAAEHRFFTADEHVRNTDKRAMDELSLYLERLSNEGDK